MSISIMSVTVSLFESRYIVCDMVPQIIIIFANTIHPIIIIFVNVIPPIIAASYLWDKS